MSELERGVSSLKAALERSGYFDKPHGHQMAYVTFSDHTGKRYQCLKQDAPSHLLGASVTESERPFWHDDCLPIEAPR